MIIENHPLSPFLPDRTRLLMLGSFPPPRKRWSMEFYYPNLNNDMWRIMGYLFFEDKNHFLTADRKAFCKESIIAFLKEKHIALFDTGSQVCRLQDNASDKFLDIITPTDIQQLLMQLPECQAIVTTGQKATDTLRQQIDVADPAVGDYADFRFIDRSMRLYRMPSSSRAYPLALEQKASRYRTLFEDLHLL